MSTLAEPQTTATEAADTIDVRDAISVVWLASLRKDDVAVAGGKGANLGELLRGGMPVPNGFVVPADAYLDAMGRAGIREQLRARAVAADPSDATGLEALARSLSDAVRAAPMPQTLADDIRAAYATLREGDPDTRVAVRSSATAEDTAGTSFAGMHRTFTNVASEDALLSAVRACWASVFSARVLSYRVSQRTTDEPAVAVVVQRMVDSDRSGVAFTADPSTGDTRRVVVEGAFGLGEIVVSGAVQPDTYVLDKGVNGAQPRLLEVHVGLKEVRIQRAPDGGDTTVTLDPSVATSRVLTDEEAVAVAGLACAVEVLYGGVPQDIEWAYEGDRLFVLQARPITTIQQPQRAATAAPAALAALVTGLGAAPGVASGRVRVLTSPAQTSSFLTGEVLVAPNTSPDWVPAMRRAAAVVTERGGLTCHAAIVSRELRIPCVVGARKATALLRDCEMVTVDGASGLVSAGAAQQAPTQASTPVPSVLVESAHAGPSTATLLYLNVAFPEQAERAASLQADGVGLLRAEFMLTDALGGTHPAQLLTEGGRDEFIERMSASVERIARAFAPRPVVYRTIDFRTNEFRGLRGGESFEHDENNPMIGYRGCYRYVKDPELFGLELTMLAKVREDWPNVAMMIPFVRTAWELEACLRMVDASELGRQRGLKRWVMAEVPSIVHRMRDYAAMGIDGVSIGSNDLTQLMLGVDRDSEVCAELFDESDAAVLDAIERIIDACHQHGLTSSLCGQAPSNRPAFAEHLVRFGISSVSVDPDAADRTRRVLDAAERRVLLQSARLESARCG